MSIKYRVSYLPYLANCYTEEYFEIKFLADWLVEELEKQFPFVKNVTLEKVKIEILED